MPDHPPRALVLGIGSPFGDDRLGWVAAERVAASPLVAPCLGTGVAVITRDRPGLALLNDWRGAEAVVLLDAIRRGASAGAVHRARAEELPVHSNVSSHGLGVAEALALARCLGALPPRLVILGIEPDFKHPGAGLSRAVESALPGLVELAERELAPYLADEPCRRGVTA